jgi:hypothetical protein
MPLAIFAEVVVMELSGPLVQAVITAVAVAAQDFRG